jgi:predicted double-glycine peptidase
MRRRVIRPLCLALLLWRVGFVTSVAAEQIRSLLEMRRNAVVIQTHWWSCGAAAVATLLTSYYAIPVTETETLTLIARSNPHAAADSSIGQALTLLALKQALQAKGIESKAYRLDAATLYDYFSRGGLPLIMRLSYPQAHFVVGIGIVEDSIAVADPSFGERLIDWTGLVYEHGFTGYVLVPIPATQQLELVHMRQEVALARFFQRYAYLDALGGDLHHW